jgi:hypothetical protein
MRFLFLLFLFGTISFSFTNQKKSSSELIIPGEQAGPIKLGYTTLQELKDSLGITAPIKNDCYMSRNLGGDHWCTVGMFYEYYLIDSARGLWPSAHCDRLHVIYEMYLFSPCNWKTADGFGIGSSFEEIKAKLGTPIEELDTIDRGNHEYSIWHTMKYKNIQFISRHKMNEPGGCCVDVIYLTCDKDTRPKCGKPYRALFFAPRPHYHIEN